LDRGVIALKKTVYTLPGREGKSRLEIDLAREGAQPRIVPRADGGGYRVYLFSDLKRHDMGLSLAESRPDRGRMPSCNTAERPGPRGIVSPP
jgi:hypothetical protein